MEPRLETISGTFVPPSAGVQMNPPDMKLPQVL